MRVNKYLAVGLMVAGVTGLYTYIFLAGYARQVPVVVAARDIPGQAKVTGDMLKVVALHPGAVHADAATRKEEALGRFAVVPILQGEQVLKAKLSGDPRAGDVQFHIEGHQRAVLVPFALPRGLGGAVKVGDRIDLIFVSSEQKMGYCMAKTVLRNVPVLDVRTEDARSAQAGGKGGAPIGVLVGVGVEGAERIAFCLENGYLYLVLNPYQPDFVPTAGVTAESVFRESLPAAPPPRK